MKFLVDFDRPHYLIRVLTLSLPPILMHYLLVIKSAFTTYMGSNRGGCGGRGRGGRGHGGRDQGVVGVNKGVVVKDMVFVSALIVMVRIIQ